VGHVGQQSGFGRSATDFCRALLRAGVRVDIAAMSESRWLPPDLEPHRVASATMHRDAVIVHTLPLHCEKTLDLAAQWGDAKKRIAYTTWETMTAPEHIALSLKAFDEVWTPSIASQYALSRHSGAYSPDDHADDAPLEHVAVIPHCFDPKDPFIERALYRQGKSDTMGMGTVVRHGRALGRARASSSEPVRFYWIGAWNARKNPHAVLRAFAHQFSNRDDVELVMHSSGADAFQCYAALAQTGIPQNELPPISIHTQSLTDEEIWAMHMNGDVFVSASRGEAWNLPAFEAMLAGKVVIATKGLGSDDFLDSEAQISPNADYRTNALMVHSRQDIAWDMVKAGSQHGGAITFASTGVPGLTSKCLWSEPNNVDLALEMHHAANNMVRRGTTGEMFYDPIKAFGYETVAKLMIERIFA
jgi:glycosyltransferase involved in cell wall biosynthesis